LPRQAKVTRQKSLRSKPGETAFDLTDFAQQNRAFDFKNHGGQPNQTTLRSKQKKQPLAVLRQQNRALNQTLAVSQQHPTLLQGLIG